MARASPGMTDQGVRNGTDPNIRSPAATRPAIRMLPSLMVRIRAWASIFVPSFASNSSIAVHNVPIPDCKSGLIACKSCLVRSSVIEVRSFGCDISVQTQQESQSTQACDHEAPELHRKAQPQSIDCCL